MHLKKKIQGHYILTTYKYNNIVIKIIKWKMTTQCVEIINIKYSTYKIYSWNNTFLCIINYGLMKGNAPNGFKNIIQNRTIRRTKSEGHSNEMRGNNKQLYFHCIIVLNLENIFFEPSPLFIPTARLFMSLRGAEYSALIKYKLMRKICL